MKKKFMVLAVMGLLAVFGGIADAAADVAINETNFPDAYFREYVRTNFDVDGDRNLSEREIKKVKEISLSGEPIGYGERGPVYEPVVSSLKGIEYFTELKELSCAGNQLKELDVSHNPALECLWCNSNQLEELDIDKNSALKNLDCSWNQLKKLDVGHAPLLTQLMCSYNQLEKLDVRHNLAIERLGCYGNRLKELDVSYNVALKELSCGENQLSNLDISRNLALEFLQCNLNQLTMLDMSRNVNLKSVAAGQYLDKTIEAKQTSNGWQVDLSELVEMKDISKIVDVGAMYDGEQGAQKLSYYDISSTGILTFTCKRIPDSITYFYYKGNPNEIIAYTTFKLKVKACSHSFGSYVTTTEPTVDKPGVATRTCTVCGTTETKELPKLKGTIKLSSSTLTVSVKQTVSAKAMVGGMQKGDSIKKWQSANTKIATVDKNGNITGIAAGKVKIRVKLKSGASAILKVTVQGCSHSFGAYVTTTEPTVLKAGVATRTCSICGATETKEIPKLKGTVKFSTSSLSIQLNRTISLKALVGGMQKGDAIKTWQSADKRIATVDKNGNITGVAAGRVKIRVKLKSGASAILKVTVHKGTVATEAIQGLNKKLAVAAGKTVTLKPQLKPVSSTQKITYRSSDNKIVTVDANGVVKGVKAGTAKIQVKSGNVKFIIKVKVTK